MATLTRRTDAQTARRADIEAHVLEATEALLAEGASFAELPIEQIATRAGISRTAFYFYFRDKRELLTRLTEDIAESLYGEADAWWSAPGDGTDQLQRALERVVALYHDHDVLLRAVVEASAYDEQVGEFWRALLGRFSARTQERIEAEQAAGRVADMPAGETAFALVWMTERACYQRLVQGGSVEDDAFLQSLVGIWLRSVYGRLEG
jgi:TetR/AcrR family transcriptional regulator, ethionamide resistance regulator